MLDIQLIVGEWRIYASVNYAISGLETGLLPIRHQTISLCNAGLLRNRP